MIVEIVLAAVLPLVPFPQTATEMPGSVGDVAPTYECDPSLGKEACRLRIAEGKIVVASSTESGAFYAEKKGW